MSYPTPEEIRSLCTEQSFERGRNYWRQGRIQTLEVDGEEIRATVRGSHEYDISIDVADETVHTHCSCPYDYAGDCKHIVAVLLAVDDRADDRPDEQPVEPVDVNSLIDRTSPDELRAFLRDVIADETEIRDRFVAFAGEETGKTVYDYKQEVDRLFENASGRGGFIEYGTWIDFSKFHDLAKTHRERGHVAAATKIYRALAETIRENYDRVDDSSGHYGQELERAIDGYAETILEHDLDHESKQSHIEYLCGEFIEAEYSFASDYYDDALQTVCTSSADLEYWLTELDEHVSGVELEPTVFEQTVTSGPDGIGDHSVESGDDVRNGDEQPPTHERTDDILYSSDLGDGPLTVEEFTGGTLDIEHLAVGPLEFGYFVGDAFDELRIDDPTTVEEHTADLEPDTGGSSSTQVSSLQRRNVLSTYIYLLEELDEEDALSALYEEIYLENSRFCKQYADRLLQQEKPEQALEVVENGLETFGSKSSLQWLAAELYRERDEQQYRETLKRLFLDHTDWSAYDELKEVCSDEEWQSISEEIERRVTDDDRQRLLRLYVHEDRLEAAFSEVVASGNLSWFRRYRDPVGQVHPEEYFEKYKEELVPFAAGETGRRHYRAIADHLAEMEQLVSQERFEEFVDFLKEKHSNRPAFLDELEKAGL